ncbi:MAG TPA: 50S ribosomal protein L35 [Gammaproteobacteria bacterium]|nr:50S ribosomal protein L35 [Gammaproteobacteria bacterium]
MHKAKTHKGAAKRFRRTKNGIKFRRSNRNHILTKKSTRAKVERRASGQISAADFDRVSDMLK